MKRKELTEDQKAELIEKGFELSDFNKPIEVIFVKSKEEQNLIYFGTFMRNVFNRVKKPIVIIEPEK